MKVWGGLGFTHAVSHQESYLENCCSACLNTADSSVNHIQKRKFLNVKFLFSCKVKYGELKLKEGIVLLYKCEEGRQMRVWMLLVYDAHYHLSFLIRRKNCNTNLKIKKPNAQAPDRENTKCAAHYWGTGGRFSYASIEDKKLPPG